MSKHTPGQWRSGLRPVRIAHQLWEKLVSPDNTLITLVLRSDDARLIAAAPEMRKALEDLATQVERSNAVDDNGHELKNLQALHVARTLLARIDGGE